MEIFDSRNKGIGLVCMLFQRALYLNIGSAIYSLVRYLRNAGAFVLQNEPAIGNIEHSKLSLNYLFALQVPPQ